MTKNGDFKLTKVQFIAVMACQRAIQNAQADLRQVQEEIGFDLSKQYRVGQDGVVHEIKPEVTTQAKEKK